MTSYDEMMPVTIINITIHINKERLTDIVDVYRAGVDLFVQDGGEVVV